jgi:drug/metabolite transporter (DMT)-like permease
MTGQIVAYGEALLVTFLWSTSFVLIKQGLNEVSPLLFSAMRYSLAFGVLGLADLTLRGGKDTTFGDTKVALLIVAGICGYTLAQGFQYLGLFYISAVATSFLQNFTPIFVLILGVLLLHKKTSRLQFVGLAVALVGALAFFSERLSWNGEPLGVPIVIIGAIAWAIYLVVVERIQRISKLGSLRLTLITMGIGATGLLLLAVIFEGLRSISLGVVFIVLWLSVVNTALAFVLWNHALRFIRAYELSVIQNSMLVQIAILAWFFLGESLSLVMVVGMVLVIAGVLLVQIPAIKANNRQVR